MIYNLKVDVNQITDTVVYYNNTNDGRRFPIVTIDEGSYSGDTIIESGINLDLDGGVHNVQIGRFNSIAYDVHFVIDFNHDYKSVLQGFVPMFGTNRPKYINRKGQIIIQNDCWIGRGVTIMGGVTIHNGAVVAANATVTKDVPPYAIVAGVPAKIIGYRFSQEIIDKLQEIKLWYWSDEKMLQYHDLIMGPVEEFVNSIVVEKEIINNPIKRLTNGNLFVYYLDINKPFPLYPKVIKQYIENFSDTDSELLLYLNQEAPLYKQNYNIIINELSKYQESNCYINIYTEQLNPYSSLLIDADYYISNRSKDNVYLMCEADYYGVKCLSGVDSNIFYKL